MSLLMVCEKCGGMFGINPFWKRPKCPHCGHVNKNHDK